jgi:hypothetical protein
MNAAGGTNGGSGSGSNASGGAGIDGVDETVVVVDVVVDADVVGSGGAATTDCTVEIDAPRPFLARDSGPVTMSKEIGPVPGGAAL